MRGRVRRLYISLFDKAHHVRKTTFATSFMILGGKVHSTSQEENSACQPKAGARL